MTRRYREPKKPKKKGGGGMLMGMRSGVQKVAGRATSGEAAAEEATKARWKVIASNVVTAVLVIAAGAMLLRRCGVVHF